MNDAASKIDKIVNTLNELEDNTGNDEVDDLITYALAHLKYALKVLRGES